MKRLRRYVFLVTVAAVAAVAGACSDDDSTVPGSGSGAAAGAGSLEAGAGNDGSGGVPSGPMPEVCGSCADDEDCFVVRVSRHDAFLPWMVSPDLADGVGTLVVSLQGSPIPDYYDVYATATVPDVSFVSDGTEVDVPLCTRSEILGSWVHVFFDDNENAAEGATDSDDPADACPDMTRVVDRGFEAAGYMPVELIGPCG